MLIELATAGALLLSTIAAYFRPDWLLLDTIALLPFERIGSFPLNPATGHPLIHPAEITALGLIAGWLVRQLKDRRLPPRPSGLYWLLGFAALALLPVLSHPRGLIWQP